MNELLNVEHLSISFHTYNGEVQAVRDASFQLGRGEVLAVVGESGSGKSVMMQTILKLTPCELKGGRIEFDGKDITDYTDRQMQEIRGSQIGIIFQDAMTSLNPTMKIGRQITESLLRHQKLTRAEAKKKALELLRQVGINNPEKRFHQYIHNLSGGMRQRVMIAMMLSRNPELLIADEPTTALDVTIEAQILEIIKELKEKFNTAIMLITHNFGLVAEVADRIGIMYAGEMVESGDVFEIFENPTHPYTRLLMQALPRNTKKEGRLQTIDGSVPRITEKKPGCRFANRCPYAKEICKTEDPAIITVGENHICRCHLAGKEEK